jgi:hypothetical protein
MFTSALSRATRACRLHGNFGVFLRRKVALSDKGSRVRITLIVVLDV